MIEPGEIIYYGPWYKVLVLEVNLDTFWVYSFDRNTYHQLSFRMLKFFYKFE